LLHGIAVAKCSCLLPPASEHRERPASSTLDCMGNILVIALGAAIGANLRYGLSLWAARQFGAAFPYGTLIVNLIGCFAIGLVLQFSLTRMPLSEPLRLLIVTGLLGGFTTFSSFGYETYALILKGEWLPALIYIAASVVLGLGAVFLGAALISWLYQQR
jgi:fluoride exporter